MSATPFRTAERESPVRENLVCVLPWEGATGGGASGGSRSHYFSGSRHHEASTSAHSARLPRELTPPASPFSSRRGAPPEHAHYFFRRFREALRPVKERIDLTPPAPLSLEGYALPTSPGGRESREMAPTRQ